MVVAIDTVQVLRHKPSMWSTTIENPAPYGATQILLDSPWRSSIPGVALESPEHTGVAWVIAGPKQHCITLVPAFSVWLTENHWEAPTHQKRKEKWCWHQMGKPFIILFLLLFFLSRKYNTVSVRKKLHMAYGNYLKIFHYKLWRQFKGLYSMYKAFYFISCTACFPNITGCSWKASGHHQGFPAGPSIAWKAQHRSWVSWELQPLHPPAPWIEPVLFKYIIKFLYRGKESDGNLKKIDSGLKEM